MLLMPRLVLYGASAALVLSASLAAQSVSGNPQHLPAEAGPCDSLPSDIPHDEALRGVCHYAVTVPLRMPNFTCQQETSRLLRGAHEQTDTITGVVTYEDGRESYQDLKRNGQPVDSIAPLRGAWSAGQFGSNLQSIFDGRNKVEFHFAGEKKIKGRQAWEFTYRIAHQEVPLWQLRVQNEVVAPPYYGKLWIDQRAGLILCLEMEASEIPWSFPIRTAKLEIDYENVLFADGTRFVLPVKSELHSSESNGIFARNIQRFQSCRKFRGTARIVPW
jgi:hypothetical protein